MPTVRIDLETDDNGYLHKTHKYNPPGPFSLSVELSAKIIQPAATTVQGELDIDATDGSPSNQKKAFRVTTGGTCQLGSWRLDGGDNVIVLTGKTIPPQAKTKITFEIEAKL